MYATFWMPLLLGAVVLTAFPGRGEEIKPESYRPSWQVGEKWIVETVCRQVAARRDPPAAAEPARVRWRFEVEGTEKVEQRECFRLQVTCLAGGEETPTTTLWVDRQSMTLRKASTRLPTPGGQRTLTEYYHAPGDQPFPAFAPLTVPPLELPLLLGQTKGTENYTYEASSSPLGVKAIDDVGFSVSVQQHFARPDEDQIKDLLPETYAKSLAKKATLEVRLEAAHSQVRQLWQPGVPWPVYSNNGIAEARLVEFVPPKPQP